jgi:adenylate cyclase
MSATGDNGASPAAGKKDADDTTTLESAQTYADAALEQAKTEGLRLAVRARWTAMAIIAVMLPIVNPNWGVLYYHGILVLFCLIGWAQLRVGAVGRSRPELLLILLDLLLMTLIVVVPNPFDGFDWPKPMQYRFESFIFFFVILAAGTLHYSWRTIVAMATWTVALWTLGAVYVTFFPNAQPEMTTGIYALFGDDPKLASMLDPNNVDYGLRLQELVAFIIVAGTLAMTVKRSGELLRKHAAVERERTNLARYFSPNVVDELSHNDEPLKRVRTQNVAVLFVDIVGFTQISDGQDPEIVIRMLREFHGRMEREVFRHGGTLDKYLGDGLMATFGTPIAGDTDAVNALHCAQAMMISLQEMNRQRETEGQPPIRAGFGLHYGPVVLGDIGANRLEFAVIGSTVNAASRLEAMTRTLGCDLVASDELIRKARAENGESHDDFAGLKSHPSQLVRGIEQPIDVWSQGIRH